MPVAAAWPDENRGMSPVNRVLPEADRLVVACFASADHIEGRTTLKKKCSIVYK